MWGRRLAYLGILMGTLLFYGFYLEWFSWLLLVTVVTLPWISLLLSLPAMLTVKADLRCPAKARKDVPVRTSMEIHSFMPTPPIRCVIRVTNSLTGVSYLGEPGERLPMEHCGLITISYPKMYVYDYMGLFRRRLKKGQTCQLFVEPKAIPTNRRMEPAGKAVNLWKPKPGGGFSEVHDLRLYRPGDDLRNIHWKMAAKLGKLVYREPMEPVQKGYVLNIVLAGTPQELDIKLGQLYYASKHLLEQGLEHTVRCLHKNGIGTFTVNDPSSWETCLHTILGYSKADGGKLTAAENVLWQHHIGGDSDEA